MYQFALKGARSHSPWAHWERNLNELFTEASSHVVTPACDITETKDSYTITLDAPGVKLADLEIEVKDRQLVVTGERPNRTSAEGEQYVRRERTTGKFQRIFSLTENFQEEKIAANLVDGVLTITLPKAEKIGRKIVVSGNTGPEVQ